MRSLALVLFFCLSSFAFYPVYHSPSDWLKRSFPNNFFADPYFSGRYATNGLGLLISQRGALYFKHTDFRFDYVDEGYPFSDYFLENFNFYVPADVLKNTHILAPSGITYTNIFADNATSLNGTSLGILMTFGKPVTLESIDNSCLVPVSALYEPAKDYGDYMYFDGGDTYFNSPLIMNSGDEPCKNWFFGGDYDLSPNINVQTIYFSYYEKVSDPCPDNHIFRANSDGSITCEPCASSTYADVFKNMCVTKISEITNPFDYAKAQCSSIGSSLKYIEDSLNIVNGGDNYYCFTVCNDGTKIPNYNCPERINFGDVTYEPDCIKGNCGNGEGSENTGSNNYPYDKPYQPPTNSEKVEVSENEKGEICFSDDNCISIGGATVNDDKQICINGNCSNINSGSDDRDNTICINGDCYHLGDNGSINDNQICINGNCSNINGSGSNGSNGGSDSDNGDNGSGGNGDNNNGGSGNGGSNDNDNGLGDLCQNGECGNYDNSSLGSYFSTMNGLFGDLGSFKENLEGTYNNFKESVENTKEIFNDGFLNFKNTSSLKSCPLVFDYELGNGQKQKFNLDLCEFLFPFSNLFYLIFYIFFSAIALLFSYKILKDVFHLILNSRSS